MSARSRGVCYRRPKVKEYRRRKRAASETYNGQKPAAFSSIRNIQRNGNGWRSASAQEAEAMLHSFGVATDDPTVEMDA